MKTIYNTYVVMESQEQCDRMKQLCIDNNLPIWENVFLFDKRYNNLFGKIDCDFWVTYEKSNVLEVKQYKTQVTEEEFIELLKTK